MDTIRLKTGEKIIVTITNWIDDTGTQYSTAIDNNNNKYTIIDRDYYGAIWDKTND